MGRIRDVVSYVPIGEPLHGQLAGGVSSVVFIPDSIRAGDNTIRIWDAASGTPIALLGHSGLVISVACSPDGARVVSASSDGTIRIWDASPEPAIGSPKLILQEPAHKRQIPQRYLPKMSYSTLTDG